MSSIMTKAEQFPYVTYLTTIGSEKCRIAMNLAMSSTEVAHQASCLWREENVGQK
jgi:hypothetical protein